MDRKRIIKILSQSITGSTYEMGKFFKSLRVQRYTAKIYLLDKHILPAISECKEPKHTIEPPRQISKVLPQNQNTKPQNKFKLSPYQLYCSYCEAFVCFVGYICLYTGLACFAFPNTVFVKVLYYL